MIQDVLTYLTISIAVAYTIRQFVSFFHTKKKGTSCACGNKNACSMR